MTKLNHWLMPLLLSASGLMAQQSGLRGPVSGLVYDEPARAVRAMLGVPGSSYLGAPVLADLDFAAVAPNGRLAMALKGGRLTLVRFGAETATETLAENYPTPSLASWAADSSAVALYGTEAGIAVWRKLGIAPEPARLGNPAPLGLVSALTLEDGARSVILIARGEGNSAVYRAAEGAEPALLARGLDITAIAASADAVYLSDRGAHTVSAVRGAAEVSQIANEALGVKDPVGLALIGSDLLVASGENHELVRLNPATGELLGRIALDFAPDRLHRLTQGADGGSPLYSLKSRGQANDPLEVLDASRGAVFFVPASVE